VRSSRVRFGAENWREFEIAEFEKNVRRIVDLLTKIKNEEEKIRQGGGAKAIESQHKKGRLTAASESPS